MTTKKPTKRDQIRTLQRQKMELEAQLTGRLHFARVGLNTSRNTMGSAVVVQMHWLGGREVCPPFAIKDALSNATIDALIEDLRRTFSEQTELRP